MAITVNIYKDTRIQRNVKYRAGFSGTPVFTATAVNIGNFSSLDLFSDNGVELSIPYATVSTCNIISVNAGTITTIGHIESIEYINDNNVFISYVVDPFTSARFSGLITDMTGLCERANINVSEAFTNLQSEPFSPSDVMTANPEATQTANTEVFSLEGVTPQSNGLASAQTRFVLTVSPAVIEYLGVGAFDTPPTGFTQELKEIESLNFYSSDTTLHCGGTFKGTPLLFQTIHDVKDFIQTLLGGCGFRTELEPDGYSTQQATTYRQYLTDANSGAGQSNNIPKNEDGDPMEAIRFITADDIYNLYCMPALFAISSTSMLWATGSIRGFKTVANISKFGAEDSTKGKLTAHPYYYGKLVTANGDSVNIIPQTHYSDFSGNDNRVYITLRFIGGDNPRLMGRLASNGANQINAYDNSAINEWFTIRNYPSVTLSINNSFNPQVQKDVANTRQTSAILANSRASAQLKSPISQGYVDGIAGVEKKYNAGQSYFNRVGTAIGSALASIDSSVPGGATNTFKDKNAVERVNNQRTATAGNIITADIQSVMGNDFTSQFSIPAISIYHCGATDAEQYGFSRYIEQFGQTLNCIINPLTNSGSIFGGSGSIITVNGYTFYQFANIDVSGVMPVTWKNAIKDLFESGVYLI